MSKNILEYKCLMISPSDVEEERNTLTELVGNWNAQIGNALDTRLDLVRWESHATPEMGAEAQTILNNQIVDSCDFGIALFWSRLGTPTRQFESGSVEEVRKLINRSARVLVYFSQRAIPKDIFDIAQLTKLEEFRKEIEKEGFLGEYSDIHNLREQVLLHITSVMVNLISKDRHSIGQLGNITTISQQKPDIRIKTTLGFISTPAGVKDVFIIEIQNHSPMVVFTGIVEIKLKNKYKIVVPIDSVTGEYQRRRALQPGEKFSFHILPEKLFEQVAPDDIAHVVVTDDIDRTYESESEQLQWVLNELWKKYKGL